MKEITAASILAKVERDKYMAKLNVVYPEYGFGKHVGYGTAAHQKAMEEFGLTPEHRRSFRPVREIAEGKTTTKQLGDRGEQIVVDYLVKSGHEIVARNYKTKLFEVDIISRKNEMLYFTEVKYRSGRDFGGALDFIDKKKQQKMHLAVEGFMATHPEYADFRPTLAVAAVDKDFKLEEWFELSE